MISDFASVLTPSIKDDRNVVSKRELQKFIEDTYFNGKVENVMLGTTVTRYDILVPPKSIPYFLRLSDLAISSKDNVIKSIQRLLYKARACGIHVIISTQRPDSDFMSGKIKSNFQCRAVFSMASRWDSRVALNKYGAEKLKGNGDGIFRTNNGQSNIRFQAPYVHEKEINDVVSILCKQKRGCI